MLSKRVNPRLSAAGVLTGGLIDAVGLPGRPPLMRALGPGSVSSLLKIVLDVVHFALWTLAAALAVGGVGLLLALPFKPGGLQGHVTVDGRAADLALLVRRIPQAAVLTLAVESYLAALIVIVSRLRRVFETLILGDPFRPQNVGRLRQAGLALAALEALGFAVRLAVAWLLPEAGRDRSFSPNLTAWFAILAVFVLSEVFREGARLRGEAELTI